MKIITMRYIGFSLILKISFFLKKAYNSKNLNEQAGEDDAARADTSVSSDENNSTTAASEEAQQQAENIGRVIVRFFVTFFTSLIPERPRVAN